MDITSSQITDRNIPALLQGAVFISIKLIAMFLLRLILAL